MVDKLFVDDDGGEGGYDINEKVTLGLGVGSGTSSAKPPPERQMRQPQKRSGCV